ncbi:drug resistance transporter, EmrB/QacA subfamily [Actinopolyspora xinjiangensis]|uniref:Drug resistance transporter, EmrB/QacA subfamily n=1 Tax=Actinopolyspora xinjiangensis TaxID=405564 RepID=A0A1H0WC74_9ACTN|nr:DHA2 family efflux MFS transporter permease subunit [Actinopolyspora xinjiangensis]SDP88141.1 drug resistance transporter, EmrB/QacA subfamily [Actinopolyspora xinjiangensis]
MGVLLVGASVTLLDTTIIGVAIDDLAQDFDTSVATTQWVTTGYVLAMVAVITTMGWLTDRWGCRRVWLGAVGVFLLGSVLCSMAWSIGTLITFRIVQGLGGGLILPLVQAILARAAGPRRVGRVMGYVGIPGQLAPMLGPVLGGLLLATVGWRWIFLVNIPICLLALVLAHRHLTDDDPRTPTRLDRGGLVLLLPAAVAILWGCTAITERTVVPAPAPLMLCVGIVLVSAFWLHARRLGHQALLDVGLFRLRSFSIATLMMFQFGFSLYGSLILLPLFYQRIHEVEVGDVGLLLVPQGLGTMAALWLAGRWTHRLGPRLLGVLGTLMSVSGTTGIAANGASAATPTLSLCLLLLGAGFGTTGVAVPSVAYRDVPPTSVPHATSLLSVLQRLGAALGTTVMAIILQLNLASSSTGDTDAAAAFSHTFWWAATFAAASLVPAALLPSRPVSPDHHPHPAKGHDTCAP